MNQLIRKYFKHTTLVREDIRDLISKFGLNFDNLKICDFGCGSGITTFGLALEFDKSICIGLDKFPEDSPYSHDEILKIENQIINNCSNNALRLKEPTNHELCKLINDNRFPTFIKGDIVTGNNLQKGIDLAFCQRIFINIQKGKHGNEVGQETLARSIKKIVNCLSPEGYLLSIEFANFDLNRYFEECGLEMIKSLDFTRNDIRSKGRTTVLSHYNAILCKK
jgi:hypothetical protein